MANKIFVGGLPWSTDSEQLKAAFVEYGEVIEAKVVTDRDTGRSRGFGFVTFSSADDAKRALEKDGTDLGGRTIRVDLANDDRGGGGRRPPRNDRRW